MKATCLGWTVEGTPSEIWQLILGMEEHRKKQYPTQLDQFVKPWTSKWMGPGTPPYPAGNARNE